MGRYSTEQLFSIYEGPKGKSVTDEYGNIHGDLKSLVKFLNAEHNDKKTLFFSVVDLYGGKDNGIEIISIKEKAPKSLPPVLRNGSKYELDSQWEHEMSDVEPDKMIWRATVRVKNTK